MKKIILPVLAVLAFGTITNAQVTQKQPVKHAAVVTAKPAITSSTPIATKPVAATNGIKKKNSSTPVRTMKSKAPAKKATIKRKHHHKTRKPKAKKK